MPRGTALLTREQLVACACDTLAAEQDQQAAVELVEGASELVAWEGVLTLEGEMTGDGRLWEEGAWRWADLPLPLRWDREDDGAHAGAVLVGMIQTIERVGDEIRGTGVIDPTVLVDGDTPIRLMLEEMPLGVSVDYDELSFEVRVDRELYEAGIPEMADGEDGEPVVETDEEGREIVMGIANGEEVMVHTDSRIRGATLVDIPAFDRARLWLSDPDAAAEAIAASVIGSTDLPVAARDLEWDGSGARTRVFELCTDGDSTDVECVSRAFLWRDPDGDPETQAAYSLGFADVVDGQLRIVPRGVAATAGGRGVDALEGVSEEDRDRIRSRICSLYDRVRSAYDDWPECPFAEAAAANARAEAEFFLAAAGNGEGSSMVALLPADPDSLAVDDDNAELPQDLHVTLVFLGEAARADDVPDGTLDAVAETAFVDGPIEGRVAGVGTLGDEDPPATVLLLNGGQIGEARGAALSGTEDLAPEQHEPFIPHLTVGYGVPLETVQDLVGTTIRFDRVALVAGRTVVEERGAAAAETAVTASAVAVKVPTRPPLEWFAKPTDGPSPLTVDDSGRVAGWIALWDSCHTGFAECVRPPRSVANYAYFLTGRVKTDDGTDVPTGRITLGTTHADRPMTAAEAQWHYEHTGAAVADVFAGEDEHGIWVAGALRPGVTEEQVRELRASPPSGDWRSLRGNLELIGVLAVNVPGFPIVASAYLVNGEYRSFITGWDGTLVVESEPDEVLTASDAKILRQIADRERRARTARARAAALRVVDARIRRTRR